MIPDFWLVYLDCPTKETLDTDWDDDLLTVYLSRPPLALVDRNAPAQRVHLRYKAWRCWGTKQAVFHEE